MIPEKNSVPDRVQKEATCCLFKLYKLYANKLSFSLCIFFCTCLFHAAIFGGHLKCRSSRTCRKSCRVLHRAGLALTSSRHSSATSGIKWSVSFFGLFLYFCLNLCWLSNDLVLLCASLACLCVPTTRTASYFH